jgi:2-(1,2-epoxy-1,2-dihydrophenyl)acetyl-CoA isomerase
MSPAARSPAATVGLEISGGVATLTLSGPERRNSIDHRLASELQAQLALASEDRDVAAVLVRAEGPSWCAGGALDELAEAGEGVHDYINAVGERLVPLVRTLHETPKVTIAVVHGSVAGGGLGLMAAHDVVIAAQSAVFIPAYRQLGLCPDAGFSYFLARDLGYRRTLELYLADERFGTARALELGLVNRVVPDGELDDAANTFARHVAAGPRLAQASTKRLLRQATDGLLERQLEDEIRSIADNARTSDFAEGLRAFLERRTPDFHNGTVTPRAG